MSLVQHDHVIQALAPDRTDQAFDVWILPGRSRRRDDFFGTHVLDATLEGVAVDPVAITNREARKIVERARFDYLLRRPLSRWMRCNIEVNHPALVMAEDDKGEEDAKCSR